MNLSVMLLLAHILGAMGYSAGTLVALFGLLALRRAGRVEQVRSVLGLVNLFAPLSGIGLFFLVVSGVYMAFSLWGWRTAWIDVALGSLALLLMPCGAIMGIRRQAIGRQVYTLPDGPLPDELEQRIHDPLMGTTTVLLNALLLGIVILMVVKPGWLAALLVMGGSAGLGLVLSLPLWRAALPAGRSMNPTQ